MLCVGNLIVVKPTVAAKRRTRAVRSVVSLSGTVPGGGMRGRQKGPARGVRVIAHGKKEDEAKRALMEAMGSRARDDTLAQFDDSGGGGFGGGIKKFFGGGGGGDNDNWRGKLRSLGAFGMFGLFLAAFALFKPVTAILVNLVYFCLRLPTGREPGSELLVTEPVVKIAADADIIARYGADEDDEDEDDEDENDEDE